MGISVVIPTYQGRENLEGLFVSLAGIEFEPEDQIIVVVNGSTDGSLEFAQAIQAQSDVDLRVVRLPENLGFAAGVNAGLARAAAANDVVVLNDDVVLPDPETFRVLRETAYANTRLGIVSPLIFDRDIVIQAHGAGHLPHSGLGKTLCGGERYVGQHAGLRFCEVVPFVCAFIRRACLDEVGALDERYFAYFEDSDFCLRAAEAGWRVASTSAVAVIHYGPETTARKVAPAGELYERSSRLFLERWSERLRERFDHEVVFVAELGHETGYSVWARHVARACLDAGILVYNQPARLSPEMDRPAPDLWLRDCQGRLGRPELPQVIFEHASRFPRCSGAYRIGWTMSDVEPWPAEWLAGCEWVDEVWVPTECDAQRLRASGYAGPLYVVPLGVDPAYFHPEIRPWEGRPPADFVFASSFQWSVRKNPDLLITAFRDEFSADESVALFIKTNTPKPDEQLQYETRWWLRQPAASVYITTDPLPDWHLGGLYTMLDCFVLPSSGEGWCLPAIEALACGRPVIITGWGPPAEWGSDADGRPLPGMHFVDYQLVDCRSDIPLYRHSRWAMPDYADLRRLMRRAVEEREAWREEAELGSRVVRSRYAWAQTAKAIRLRLDALKADRPRRPAR